MQFLKQKLNALQCSLENNISEVLKYSILKNEKLISDINYVSFLPHSNEYTAIFF